MGCQKSWTHLESIFIAPDIQRQLPHEARAFLQVDRQYRDLMVRISYNANAMAASNIPGKQSLQEVSTVSCNDCSVVDSFIIG